MTDTNSLLGNVRFPQLSEESMKAIARLQATIERSKKGACLMSEEKRRALRKKRQKKKK